jgi:hypothetical protein
MRSGCVVGEGAATSGGAVCDGRGTGVADEGLTPYAHVAAIIAIKMRNPNVARFTTPSWSVLPLSLPASGRPQ